LEQRVTDFLRNHNLLPEEGKLLVAVSGGPDSVCLLHILHRLQQEMSLRLHIVHLDHRLRGAESAADADYVAELARELAIPATIETRDVPSYQARQRLSWEEAAREVRYAFFTEVATAVGANRVAVGHTRDDHIETILMHLIRGTGTRGLSGLQPLTVFPSLGTGITIIRPLLAVTRQETAAYCNHHQLSPCIDSSNLSLTPLRNRIRHQLLPLLEEYNPRVSDALERTARIASDDLDFIDNEVDRAWQQIARIQHDTVILDKPALQQLEPALQRYLLRRSIGQLLTNLKDIETRHIDQIMAHLSKPAGKRLSLPGGVTFAIEYDRYLVGRDIADLSPFPPLDKDYPLMVPGNTTLPGWRVTVTITNTKSITKTHGELTADFDLDKTGHELTVRARQTGDRFQPLGMDQPKKLGVFMIDAKIPGAWRSRIPIVCSRHHIVWVVGWRLDDRAKVTGNTKQILRLEFQRL